jgi:hypothetical protein
VVEVNLESILDNIHILQDAVDRLDAQNSEIWKKLKLLSKMESQIDILVGRPEQGRPGDDTQTLNVSVNTAATTEGQVIDRLSTLTVSATDIAGTSISNEGLGPVSDDPRTTDIVEGNEESDERRMETE